MLQKKVLLVDDDDKIRELLRLYFMKANFITLEAVDGVEAIRAVERDKPDMVLLDLMLPVIDGMEVCTQIRKFSNVPIIMLTAKDEDEDRIAGLELGADDYIAKPFNPREVVARVQAVLRRVPDASFMQAKHLSFPDLEINISEHVINVQGKKVKLTAKEMELLWMLASNAGKVFSREVLLEKIWGYEYYGETRTVDSHIRRLRQKLDVAERSPWDIETVWGVGYKFEVRV